jgi:hypothetical protein
MAATSLRTHTQVASPVAKKRKAASPRTPALDAAAEGSATSAERVRYAPVRTLAAISSALLEAGASPAEVEQCMAALPQAPAAPAPVPASLLAAFAAYFALAATLGLGISSAISPWLVCYH